MSDEPIHAFASVWHASAERLTLFSVDELAIAGRAGLTVEIRIADSTG
jgi:hypothetical protein